MKIVLCSIFVFFIPLVLAAYTNDPDSGLLFNDTKYKLIALPDEETYPGMQAALLVSPQDCPDRKHHSNSSMARVELLVLPADGGAKIHNVTEEGSEQILIVMEGAVEFIVKGEKFHVGVNELIFIPAGLERSFIAAGAAARVIRAEWRESGAAVAPGARPFLVSEKLKPLLLPEGEGYLTVTPNARQQVNPLSIISYGASHINASNSLLLYSSDLGGPHPFVANTRFARIGLSQYHAGGGTRWHFHPDREQCFVILSGNGLFEIGANTIEVKRGDIVFAPRHVGHSYRTTGEEPFKFLELEWGRN